MAKRKPHIEVDGVEMKWCGTHRRYEPISDFARKTASWDGLQATCRDAQDVAARAWQKENHEKTMLHKCRTRAKQAGVPCTITADDLVVPSHCPVLGIQMVRGLEDGKDNSPSVDRIIPERGYVKGNIAIISYRANRIKNNATPAELTKVSKWLNKSTSPTLSQEKLNDTDTSNTDEPLQHRLRLA